MSFHVLEVMDESARHTRARASGDTRITNVVVRARRETRDARAWKAHGTVCATRSVHLQE